MVGYREVFTLPGETEEDAFTLALCQLRCHRVLVLPGPTVSVAASGLRRRNPDDGDFGVWGRARNLFFCLLHEQGESWISSTERC